MFKRTTKRLSATDWAERVERWTQSGKGAKEFAATIGVEPHRLSWWKWHLSKRAPGTKPDQVAQPLKGKPRGVVSERKGVESSFLPVRVKMTVPGVATRTGNAGSVSGSSSSAVEIVLADGTAIRLPNHCSPEWIAEVLGAVRKATRAGC